MKNFSEFFSLLRRLSKMDESIARFFLQNKIIGKLGALTLYESIESPLDSIFDVNEEFVAQIQPFLSYNDNMKIEPNINQEDFFKKEKVDIVPIIRFAWEMFRYSHIEGNRENHKEFPFHRGRISYVLDKKEIEAWEYDMKTDIYEDFFSRISLDNKRGIALLSNILMFLCYDSAKETKAINNYILKEMKIDKIGKRTNIYYILIKKMIAFRDKNLERKVISCFRYNKIA